MCTEGEIEIGVSEREEREFSLNIRVWEYTDVCVCIQIRVYTHRHFGLEDCLVHLVYREKAAITTVRSFSTGRTEFRELFPEAHKFSPNKTVRFRRRGQTSSYLCYCFPSAGRNSGWLGSGELNSPPPHHCSYLPLEQLLNNG